MPSNTDDGIEVVARAIDPIAWEFHDDPKWAGDTLIAARIMESRPKAQAAIDAYETHLRDKGMVVVPREDGVVERLRGALADIATSEDMTLELARRKARRVYDATAPVQSER